MEIRIRGNLTDKRVDELTLAFTVSDERRWSAIGGNGTSSCILPQLGSNRRLFDLERRSRFSDRPRYVVLTK
jgi:hypothetical protein